MVSWCIWDSPHCLDHNSALHVEALSHCLISIQSWTNICTTSAFSNKVALCVHIYIHMHLFTHINTYPYIHIYCHIYIYIHCIFCGAGPCPMTQSFSRRQCTRLLTSSRLISHLRSPKSAGGQTCNRGEKIDQSNMIRSGHTMPKPTSTSCREPTGLHRASGELLNFLS